MRRLWRLLAAVGLALVCVVLGDAASWADPIATVSCRDATSTERGGRAGGTTCSWTQVNTACTSFDVTVSGPLLVGMSGPQWTTNQTALSFTLFHPAITLAQGYRMVVSVVCVTTTVGTTRSVPYVFGYDVGRCDSTGVCSTAARTGVVVTQAGVLPVQEVSPQPYPTFPPVVVPTPQVNVSANIAALPPCPVSTPDPSATPVPSPSPSAGTRGVDCALLASVDASSANPFLFGLAILVVLAVASFIYRHGTPLRGLRRWSK